VSILQLTDIGFSYGTKRILSHISFEVGKGEIIGIIGPNGSGKTTLLKVINGLLPPQEGEVRVGDKITSRKKRRDMARIMAYVPQEFSLVFPFNVREIVMMGRYPHLSSLRFEGEKDFLIVQEAMNMTDTLPLADRKILDISGGERQRVFIARALAQKPDIMLLDEATAFLDIKYQVALFELIRKLNCEGKLTVLVVTHDINLAAQYTDRIVLLQNGGIHAMGTADEVITEGGIKKVYEADVLVDKNPQTGVPRVTLLKPPPL
jgi:iron complex transport system ATP-binding protein